MIKRLSSERECGKVTKLGSHPFDFNDPMEMRNTYGKSTLRIYLVSKLLMNKKPTDDLRNSLDKVYLEIEDSLENIGKFYGVESSGKKVLDNYKNKLSILEEQLDNMYSSLGTFEDTKEELLRNYDYKD